MQEIYRNKKVKSILIYMVKAFLIAVVLLVLVASFEVNHALHPPRIIPPGNTLREYKIPFQSINLMTEDGIRLSSCSTPPRNGSAILRSPSYGDNRPYWLDACLA